MYHVILLEAPSAMRYDLYYKCKNVNKPQTNKQLQVKYKMQTLSRLTNTVYLKLILKTHSLENFPT